MYDLYVVQVFLCVFSKSDWSKYNGMRLTTCTQYGRMAEKTSCRKYRKLTTELTTIYIIDIVKQ